MKEIRETGRAATFPFTRPVWKVWEKNVCECLKNWIGKVLFFLRIMGFSSSVRIVSNVSSVQTVVIL